MPKYLAAIFAVLLVVTVARIANAETASPEPTPHIDPFGDVHLKCYDIHHSLEKPVTLNLKDQFPEEKDVRIRAASLLCEPASKATSPETPGNPPDQLPYTCYAIRGKSVKKTATLQDQTATWNGVTVETPKFLCDPTTFKQIEGKSPREETSSRSPLKCHVVSMRSVIQGGVYNVRDQFHREDEVKLDHLEMYCESASKVVVPDDHQPTKTSETGQRTIRAMADKQSFTCYAIKGSTTTKPLGTKVTVKDQFGEMKVTVERPRYFCNPAKKTLEE